MPSPVGTEAFNESQLKETSKEAPPPPSRQSQRGLDWFIFFLADVQTGFGPFVAVYLTTQKWTQVEIGFVLSIGGIVGLIGQMPGGAIVDAARSERLVASLAVATIGVLRARICRYGRSFRSWSQPQRCMRPRAACSVRRSPRSASAWSDRMRSASGWDATPASPRSATASAAALMGACGYLLSSRSVFVVTSLLAIPTLLALARIREREIDVAQAHGAPAREVSDASTTSVWQADAPASAI